MSSLEVGSTYSLEGGETFKLLDLNKDGKVRINITQDDGDKEVNGEILVVLSNQYRLRINRDTGIFLVGDGGAKYTYDVILLQKGGARRVKKSSRRVKKSSRRVKKSSRRVKKSSRVSKR